MLRYIAAMMFVLALVYNGKAQTNCSTIIKGSVVEVHNLEPIPYAVIHIDETGTDYQSDERGQFVMRNICAGTYHIHIYAQGHEELADNLVVEKDAELRFKLKHLENVLQEVTVKEERTHTIVQSKDYLAKAALVENAGKTLGDLLKEVNGVSTLNNGANIVKPVIHGMHSNRILLLNNGLRQEDQQWGSEHAPNIDPFVADKITVLKGAASARYGTDAIGGVVLIEPAPLPRTPGWNGGVNISANSNNRMGVISGMVEHNFKDVPALSIRAQGTYKKGGNYKIPGYWVANTGVQEANYSVNAGWKKVHYGLGAYYSHFSTEIGIYRGSHTGNEKDLMAAINSPAPLVPAEFTYEINRPKQVVLHDLAKLKAHADTRIGMWELVYGYQHNYRQEYDVIRVDKPEAQLNLTLNTQTLNLNLDHKPIGRLTGQVGVDALYQENFLQPGDRVFIPNYLTYGAAGYLIERMNVKNVALEGGLRYDYRKYDMYNPEGNNQQVVHYALNYQNLSATLGAKQDINKNWSWLATVASAWRAPQANELFSAGLHHGAARIELGNKDLKAEHSYNLNVDVKYQQEEKLSATVSLYTQYINNYIYLEPGPDVLTIRGYFKTFNYKQTNAWFTGADVTVDYNWNSHFNSVAKAAIVRARDVSKNDWLILIPSDRLSLSNRYTTNISKRVQRAYAEIEGRYVFRQVRIPRNFDQIDYPRPPEGYFLLDASIGADVLINNRAITASVTLANALNTQYRDYMDALRYFIDQPGRSLVVRVHIPLFKTI
jgi:iron complex outermembrane receptor protein